jgi:hypothetical protein
MDKLYSRLLWTTEADDLPLHWDCKPQFWEDILPHHLWQTFAGVHHQEGKHRMTEAVLGLECLDLELCDSEPEPCADDDNLEAMTDILAEPSHLSLPKKMMPSPTRTWNRLGALSFLTLQSWDPEEFEELDAWNRPDAVSWESKRFAAPCKLQKMPLLNSERQCWAPP